MSNAAVVALVWVGSLHIFFLLMLMLSIKQLFIFLAAEQFVSLAATEQAMGWLSSCGPLAKQVAVHVILLLLTAEY